MFTLPHHTGSCTLHLDSYRISHYEIMVSLRTNFVGSDRFSLRSLWPGNHTVDQPILEFRDLPTSAT